MSVTAAAIKSRTERAICKYDLLQQNIISLRKNIVLDELKILSLTGKSVIFENQELIASDVIHHFRNRKIINIMVVSKTQSGKTGSMCATIKQYLESSSNIIPIDNIYIITGLSSCEWKDQTKERMPASIQSNVFHRCELPNTFVNDIKNKKNVLIIMDEIQVAARKGQTIYKSFKDAGLLNKANLYANDIKILEYTATPDGTIYDLMNWKDASAKILARVGDSYVSSFDLLVRGRVKQYKNLCDAPDALDSIREIKADIDRYKKPLYHIIRTKTGISQDPTIDNFNQIFDVNMFDYLKYDGESDIDDINKTLSVKPRKHTFVFIKEMLRCSKTLIKTNIGVLYERYNVRPDDTTIIQGLVGRDTGYDNNGISICYTNIPSIEKYERLWNSGFEDKTIKWISRTTSFANGVLSGKNTFNDPREYNNENTAPVPVSTSTPTLRLHAPIITIFRTQEEVKTYFDERIKPLRGGRGPNKITPNAAGFYEAIIRSVKKVYSCAEINNEKRFGLKDDNYRLYPCYENTTNPTTLQWWFIHY